MFLDTAFGEFTGIYVYGQLTADIDHSVYFNELGCNGPIAFGAFGELITFFMMLYFKNLTFINVVTKLKNEIRYSESL